jgi:hypothetical protein
MQVVYHAENIVDAHLVKDALDHAGIPCFINGEFLTGGIGQLPARDFLTVSVPDNFVDEAGQVVREVEAMLHAPVAEGGQAASAPQGEGDGVPPLDLWPRPA